MSKKQQHLYVKQDNPNGTSTILVPLSCKNYSNLSIRIQRPKICEGKPTYDARLIHKKDRWDHVMWSSAGFTADSDNAAVLHALDEVKAYYADVANDTKQIHDAVDKVWTAEQKRSNLSPALPYSHIKFHSVTCQAPVECLIEDANMLQSIIRSIDKGDFSPTEIKDKLETVVACLDAVIHAYTPNVLGFGVSVGTPVDLSVANGIITDALNQDIKCGAGRPISSTMANGVCQCSTTCLAGHRCDPAHGVIFMTIDEAGGPVYTGQQNNADLLERLLADEGRTT